MQTFRSKHCTIACLTLALVLSACGGGGSDAAPAGGGGGINGPSDNPPGGNDPGNPGNPGNDPGNESPADLTATSPVEAGAYCAEGGSKVDQGLDTDDNGTLDAGEVRSTKYRCNTAQGVEEWLSVTDPVQAKPHSATGYGYMATSETAQVAVTLPANLDIPVGDSVRVKGAAAGGWKIVPNADQVVKADALASWTTHHEVVTEMPPQRTPWSAVGSSADGRVLAAAEVNAQYGQLWMSKDGGENWAHVLVNADTVAKGFPGRAWSSVALSHDGTTIMLTVKSLTNWGWIYVSTDSGANWQGHIIGPHLHHLWVTSSMSDDGQKLAAADGLSGADTERGFIYTSISSFNDGAWTRQEGAAGRRNWGGVAYSGDGNQLVAVVNGGHIYTADTSTADANGVFEWTERHTDQVGEQAGTTRNWVSVASSRDGQHLVAAESGGKLYVSSDFGANWVAIGEAGNWKSVDMSADGSKIVAVKDNQSYTFTNGGLSWSASPSGAFAGNANAVALSGDGGKVVAVDDNLIYTAKTRTAAATGSITGTQSDSVDLIYRGEGVFEVSNHEGTSMTVQ